MLEENNESAYYIIGIQAIVPVTPQLTFGVSRLSDSPAKLNKLLKEALICCESRFISEGGAIFAYRAEKRDVLHLLVDKLLMAMETGEEATIRDSVQAIPALFKRESLQMLDLIYLWNQLAASINRFYPRGASSSVVRFMDAESLLNEFGTMESMLQILSDSLIAAADGAEASSKGQRTDNEGFNKLLAYVNENYSENIILRDLADQFFINQTYCSELFKKVTGVTFSEYLNRLRLEKAAQLLKDTPKTIEQIAEQVGYKDCYYFNRVFKRYYGISPSKLRRQEQ